MPLDFTPPRHIPPRRIRKKRVPLDWIVICGSIVDTTKGGGFEFFGPFTEAEAEQVRQSLDKPGELTTIAIQLLGVYRRRFDAAATS